MDMVVPDVLVIETMFSFSKGSCLEEFNTLFPGK